MSLASIITPSDELRESILTEFCEAATPTTYDSSKGLLTVTVIQPGFNKSGARYYPKEVLQRDHQIFSGAKMFLNHQTSTEEKSRPEGDLRDWVANLKRVWMDPSSGSVMGEAVVIDPTFKKKLETLRAAGELPSLGVSIRAMGTASTKEVDGRKTNYIEGLTQARSVDFVTFAGAGGKVEALESEVTGRSELVESFIRLGLTEEEAKIAAAL